MDGITNYNVRNDKKGLYKKKDFPYKSAQEVGEAIIKSVKDVKEYAKWIGYQEDTAYIFLFRDALLPYLYFKSKGRKNLYPWLISRKFIRDITGLEEFDDDYLDDDEEEVAAYIRKLLHGEVFDNAGLINGVVHAIYSKSDPRAEVLEQFVGDLAKEKGLMDEYRLYKNIEKLAPMIITEERHMYKGVSINVDFFSGFVYRMLGLPEELFTPLFAIARISGWSAHRLEELSNNGKIIRPAYKTLCVERNYHEMKDR